MLPFAITGRRGLGSVQMRGVDVARMLGVPFFDLDQDLPEVDTLLIVKHWPRDVARLRSQCRRLILDPLDCFWRTPAADPVPYWRSVFGQVGCDAMLATSPAAAALMRAAGVPEVLLAPHHADPRIGRDWHNPAGPVVYAGMRCFLGTEAPAIASACTRLGRSFVVNDRHDAWRSLQGASLALSPRLWRSRTPLNTHCKPAVKLANAARAGIPCLATPDPAITTLADVPTCDGGENWEPAIAAALTTPPPTAQWTIEQHCELLLQLVTE